MSRISSCAACHGDILIPGSAQSADRMRCPLCHAQFQVKDVLAASIQAPPEAILVEQAPASIAAAVGPRLSREQNLEGLDVDTTSRPARRKRKGPGFIGQTIRVFGGGILGLALGYAGLLRFGGPQYDFLKVEEKLPPKIAVWLKKPPAGAAAAPDQPRVPQRQLKDLLDAPDAPPAAPNPNFAPPPETPAPAAAPVVPAAPTPEPATPPAALIAPPEAEPSPAAEDIAQVAEAPRAGPPAAPQPSALPGPKRLALYRATDLQTALADTGSLVGCAACNSTGYIRRPVVTGVREVKGERVERTTDRRVPCDVCNGKPSTRITPEAYARLCHLAEVVTFVDLKSAPESELTPLAEQVQKLISSASVDPKSVETIGRLAGYQLEHPERKQNGVALAGTVQQIAQEGNLYTMRIVLLGLPKVVTVVSERRPHTAIKEHDRVMILGSIVTDPVVNLNGYAGSLPQVVWGGMPVKLPTP